MSAIELIATMALRAASSPSGAAVKARHWAARAGLDRRAHNLLLRCTQPSGLRVFGVAVQAPCWHDAGFFAGLTDLSAPLLEIVFNHYGCLYDLSALACHEIVMHTSSIFS